MKKPITKSEPIRMLEAHSFPGGIVAFGIESEIFSDVLVHLQKRNMDAGGVFQNDVSFVYVVASAAQVHKALRTFRKRHAKS